MPVISTRKLRKWWKDTVRRAVFDSYGQYGEDLVIDAIVGKPAPFYVDVGANDPRQFSNTFRFYRRGGHGINIEPDPTVYERLAAARPRDINLHMGAGRTRGQLPFYRMSASTLSTFSKADADHYVPLGYRVEEVIQVPVRPLAEVLAEHCPSRQIDFMSIDVEGFEQEILAGNDWTRFRPTLVVLEINREPSRLGASMRDLGYLLVSSNGTNGMFIDAASSRALSP